MNKFKYLLFASGIAALMVIMLPVNLQAQDSQPDEAAAPADTVESKPCKRSGMRHGKGGGMGHNMPVLADIDSDGDGVIVEDELNSFRGKRMAQMAQEGRRMKHAGDMPSFQDIDKDGDGQINDAEFEAHKKEHHSKMSMGSANQ